MSSLRERKKAQTQTRILQSAKRLFINKGYVKTTMKDIAEEGEVGVGTLYNYYPSKSGLLKEIFHTNMPDLSSQIEKIQKDDFLNLQEKLYEMISKSMTIFHQFPRSFYRELLLVSSNESERNTTITDKMLDIDKQFMTLVADMLEKEKKNGNLPESYSVHRLIKLIYSILVSQMMMYLFSEHISESETLTEIMDQVYFLLGLPKA